MGKWRSKHFGQGEAACAVTPVLCCACLYPLFLQVLLFYPDGKRSSSSEGHIGNPGGDHGVPAIPGAPPLALHAAAPALPGNLAHGPDIGAAAAAAAAGGDGDGHVAGGRDAAPPPAVAAVNDRQQGHPAPLPIVHHMPIPHAMGQRQPRRDTTVCVCGALAFMLAKKC